MLRRSPRALLAWCAAVAVALLTAGLVARDLSTLHRRADAWGPELEVLVPRRDLALGARVGDDDLTTTRRHRSQLPDGALVDRDDARGRVVSTPVLAGAVLLERHLAPAARDGTGAALPPGTRAMRVPVGESVRVRAGDVVDLLGSTEHPAGSADTAVAPGAVVLGTDDGDESGSGPGVAVLVSVGDAQRVADAIAHGVVTLALAPPEDACCRTSSSGSSKD